MCCSVKRKHPIRGGAFVREARAAKVEAGCLVVGVV